MFRPFRSALRATVVSALMVAIHGPDALAQQLPTSHCTFIAIDKLVGVHNLPERPESYLETICLPEALPLMQDGRVQCEVRALFEDLETARRVCVDRFEAPGRLDENDVPYCPLRQLTRHEPLAAQGPGFYYDGTSAIAASACPGSGGRRVGFAPDKLLYILEPFKLSLHCELSHADGDAEDCVMPRQSARAERHVGRTCSLAPPTGSYKVSETYLGSPAAECGSGMCLAYGLNGDAGPDCDPAVQTCLHAQSVREHTRCTCRCSALDPGDSELCACPDGFSCEPMFGGGPVADGYCVDQRLLTR